MAQEETAANTQIGDSEISAPGGVEDCYKLTPIQRGMLYHTLYTPRPGMYIRQMIYSLDENLDVIAFHRAWESVINRHSNLRVSLQWEGLDEPIQQVHRTVDIKIEEID